MNSVEIRNTEDGSITIFDTVKNETYHSIHGAVQESMHVFISAGYRFLSSNLEIINVLEVGFGTGLNALLTISEFLDNANTSKIKQVNYVGLEPHPLVKEITDQLNYTNFIEKPTLKEAFSNLHHFQKDEANTIVPGFFFTRIETAFQEIATVQKFNLVYFDAFSPETEPTLWTKEIFIKIRDIMHRGGVLVTYCSKGIVRRTLQECGFKVERIPGPPGKHEMLRAINI